MGVYLNPGNKGFQENLDSQIYVDKTGLITYTNAVLNTRQKYVCVSRPRRFGKSMAMNMLAAYYGRGADSGRQFQNLAVAQDSDYKKHLNQYDVLKINMQEFLSRTDNVDTMLVLLEQRILADLEQAYPEYIVQGDFLYTMQKIYAGTHHSFIILIDEWDCLFREYQLDSHAQRKYLDFLRTWLKEQEFVALAYMTGILPIKKYGTHSALNMFTEYSMTNSRKLTPYFGFTEKEVADLCRNYHMSFEEMKAWYDGYDLISSDSGQPVHHAVYNPNSVVEALLSGMLDNYWNQTETYEALKVYIQMNFEGLKDCITKMLAGEPVPINIGTFSNDMTTFRNRDDVLTLLVHLGYLSYDWNHKTVSIPNKEVGEEYLNVIREIQWNEVIQSIDRSRRLLEALWNMDADTVAAGIDRAHYEIPSLEYNDENSLSCTIQLAFYFAREYYTIIREFPSGKGFADICFLPRKAHADKPAAIIELKWNQGAGGALSQIKERNYSESLREYHGNLLLAEINYDQKTKKHTCEIEKLIL